MKRSSVALLVVAAAVLVAPTVVAQGGASSDQPGVIERDSEQRSPTRERSAGQRNVVSAQDDDTGERYDLPPNFDPTFRARNTPSNVRVNIDFREADLQEVVKFFSATMNINFIVADSLQANKKITIISPEPVTVNEAYLAFLSALEMNGLTIVPQGSFLKILESGAAISEPQRPYDDGERIPNEARMVTGIISVENASIEEVNEVIGHFTSSSANVITYHNSLIVTENAANLRRIRALVARLDQGEAASNLYVYRVRYAEATEIQQQLETIFGEGSSGQPARPQTAAERRRQRAQQRRQQGDSSAPQEASSDSLEVQITEILSDERTNQLIIIANEGSFGRIREMIEILDVPTAVGGQIHVKFLEYANAEELSQTLSQLTTGMQAQQRGQGDRESAGGAASLLSGEVQITAHTPSNALVVVASPRDFMGIETVIDQLDRPQRQVYVEAVIMEIGLDVNRDLSIGASSALSQELGFLIPDQAIEAGYVESTRGAGLGQSNFPGIESVVNQDTGLGLGLLGPMLSLPGTGISLPAMALVLQATQTDNSVNVLSTPSIMTMDNEEAEIVIGERMPFQRATAGSGLGGLLGLGAMSGAGVTGGAQDLLGGLGGLGGGLGSMFGGGLYAPVDYEDVGITLRILPQINESDYVRLEVDQEVSDIKGAGVGDLLRTTTRRNVQTTVLVRDQSTIVIGGLIRDVENETVSKVPFLGDVPVLGLLFRSTGTLTSKQNLVLMLTPYIIEGEEDLQKIYERKMEERRELMDLFAQQDPGYFRTVDFQKRSGLLGRMNTQIEAAQAESRARREAMEAFEDDGPRYQILGGGSRNERRNRDARDGQIDGQDLPDPVSPSEQAPAEQDDDGGEE